MARTKNIYPHKRKKFPQYATRPSDILFNLYKTFQGWGPTFKGRNDIKVSGFKDLGLPLETIQDVQIDLQKTGKLYYRGKFFGFETGIEDIEYDPSCIRATVLIQRLRNISCRLYPEARQFWTVVDKVRNGTMTPSTLWRVFDAAMAGSYHHGSGTTLRLSLINMWGCFGTPRPLNKYRDYSMVSVCKEDPEWVDDVDPLTPAVRSRIHSCFVDMYRISPARHSSISDAL